MNELQKEREDRQQSIHKLDKEIAKLDEQAQQAEIAELPIKVGMSVRAIPIHTGTVIHGVIQRIATSRWGRGFVVNVRHMKRGYDTVSALSLNEWTFEPAEKPVFPKKNSVKGKAH